MWVNVTFHPRVYNTWAEVDYHNRLCTIVWYNQIEFMRHWWLYYSILWHFFPFAQFIPYEKDSKPCEKLPLCLVFLCCLSQGNWVAGKMWMKHGKRARLVSKESLWRGSHERKATVRRSYMDLGEQSQASYLPLTRESLLERDFLFCRCKFWLSCLCS